MGLVDVGDLLPDFAFTVTSNATGALADPTTFVAVLTAPDATTPAVSVTHVSTGVYTVAFVATMAGRWTATGTATGNGTDGVSVLAWNVAGPPNVPAVSLDEVRLELNITTTSDDDTLGRIILQATELAEGYTGRIWRRTTFVERHNGGRPSLVLRHTPVQSITSVTENGAALTAADYTLDQNAGLLWRLLGQGAIWNGYAQAVVVTYVAGPPVLPELVRGAIIDLCRHIYNRQRGGRSSDLDGLDSSGWAMPMHVRQSLDRYLDGGFA